MNKNAANLQSSGNYVSYTAQSSGTRPGYVTPGSADSIPCVAVDVHTMEWVEVDEQASVVAD